MMLLGVLILLCIVLVMGLPVPFAFGAVMIYLAIFADTDATTFLVSGHWRMNNLVLLAIPLFILAGGIMEKGRIAEALCGPRGTLCGSSTRRFSRCRRRRQRRIWCDLWQRSGNADLYWFR